MRHFVFASLVSFSLAVLAYGASNVDPVYKYAWAENAGWLNGRDANGGLDGVCLHATFLSGFVWAENVGFINLGDSTPANGTAYANADGSDSGVNIAANGDLYGLAWGENIGWINFDTRATLAGFSQQARLDRSAGRLRGYAWAENIGWVNLDDAAGYVAFALSSPADFDGDADVDLIDFAHFRTCFSGSNREPAISGCSNADFDGDHDVDLMDFGIFRGCFNGSNSPARC